VKTPQKEPGNVNHYRRLLLTTSVFTRAAFSTSSGMASDDSAAPADLKGGGIVSIEKTKQLLDAKSATFVDTRSVVNFGKGHVPGAVTAAYKEKSDEVVGFDGKLDSFELDKLPKNKAAAVAFSSDGPTSWKS
jgi:3-mercaptopyruvate sulfurtransferase SseA